MMVRVIHVFVKPDRIEDFISESTSNQNESLKEPEIKRFDVLQDSEDSGHFLLYEAYNSEQATLDHKETAHYKRWKSRVESMMQKPRESASFTAIAPKPENW